jgi:hypothetical protein
LRACRQLRLVPLKRIIDPLGVEAVSARHTDRAVRMTGQIQEPRCVCREAGGGKGLE